jgi:tRNA pseudouridine32 synthase/23S rRNA pseudouridine746 synthase
MTKGAVWLTQGGHRPQRLRRATASLATGDRLALWYDSEILARQPPGAACVADCRRYSVWHKPAGLLVEGSRYGDHATLLRQVEAHFTPPRRAWLVHRLDLEATGLILLAHTAQAAARLSALFQAREVHKRYLLEVRGRLAAPGIEDSIALPVDERPAATHYRVVAHPPARDISCVAVTMRSGRHHQIRRHFAAIGHAVLGDPKYGRDNPHVTGLRLAAVTLAFEDPWEARGMSWSIEAVTRTVWGWPDGEA